jgi:hypothetical protein
MVVSESPLGATGCTVVNLDESCTRLSEMMLDGIAAHASSISMTSLATCLAVCERVKVTILNARNQTREAESNRNCKYLVRSRIQIDIVMKVQIQQDKDM